MRRNTIERVKELLERDSIKDHIGGCWLYQKGSKNSSGHRKIRLEGIWRSVHRISAHIHWEFDMDSDILILHQQECPNPNCWNPNHLYEGTQKENVQDSIAAGTHSTVNPDILNGQSLKTHCPYGHPLDGQGETQRYCKTCKRERTKEQRERNKMSVVSE